MDAPIPDLISCITGSGPGLPRRLFREMNRENRTSFSPEEVEGALLAIEDHDPDLRLVRGLVRVSREDHKRRFEQTAADFARRAIAPDVGAVLNDLEMPIARRFAAVVEMQASRLATRKPSLRALNIVILTLELLADAGLTLEDAVPVLQQALIQPDAERAAGPANPRREGLRQLAQQNIHIAEMRRMVGLIAPWVTMSREARHECDGAEQRAAAAAAALDAAERSVVERDETIAALRRELDHARDRNEELSDRIRDTGSLGRRDVVEARARTRNFLRQTLRPLLDMGREASEVEPPSPRVMSRMFIEAIRCVDEEIEWLSSSD